MPPRKKPKYEAPSAPANGVVALTKELWQAAVNLRGSVEPAEGALPIGRWGHAV